MKPDSVDKVLMAHKAILETIINRLLRLERQVAELDDALVFAGIPVESRPSDKADGKTRSDALSVEVPERSPDSSDVEDAARLQGSDSPTRKQLPLGL